MAIAVAIAICGYAMMCPNHRELLKSKGLTELGFAFRVEERGEFKVPYLSVAIVGGGYRLQRLRGTTSD